MLVLQSVDILNNKNDLEPQVSIIVPMFNCAPFLPDFFKDMQEQSLQSFEMICVIDGATDNTLEIVKQYGAEDKRIRYFYKENGGAGTARNYGFEFARGQYVIWLDADDRYSPDLLKEMVTAAEKFSADEVLCLFESYDHLLGTVTTNLGFDRNSFPENTCVDPNTIDALFSKIGYGPTNKLYRRSFIKDNELRYSTTRVANDVKFIYAAGLVAKKIVGVHANLIRVQRCINPDSITANRYKYTQDVLLVFAELYQWLKDRGLSEKHRNSFCQTFIYGILYNAEFGVNKEFIESTVHALNEEEPWINMSSLDFEKMFGNLFDTDRMINEIERIKTKIYDNNDKSGRFVTVQLEKMQNKLEVISLIKILSKVHYNRDFDGIKKKQLEIQLKSKEGQFRNAERKLKNTEQQLKSAELKLKNIEQELKQFKYALKSTEQKLNRTKQDLLREKSSWNYKVGYVITWIPKRIYYYIKGRVDES